MGLKAAHGLWEVEEIAGKVRSLRDHGRMPNGDVSGWSFNCRLDNLHAAILDLKLKQVPEWIQRRRALAALYEKHLSSVPELRLPPPPSESSAYFDVFQNYEIEAVNRDQLREYLTKNGIETLIPWGGKGVHQFPSLGLEPVQLPCTERMFEQALMLPLHCELEDEQIVYVSDMVKTFYSGRAALTGQATLRAQSGEQLTA